MRTAASPRKVAVLLTVSPLGVTSDTPGRCCTSQTPSAAERSFNPMFGIEFAGGALIFAAFIVLYTLAVVFSLYTRKGSGISQRPYHHVYGGAPGAARASRLGSDRETNYGSRGTR